MICGDKYCQEFGDGKVKEIPSDLDVVGKVRVVCIKGS